MDQRVDHVAYPWARVLQRYARDTNGRLLHSPLPPEDSLFLATALNPNVPLSSTPNTSVPPATFKGKGKGKAKVVPEEEEIELDEVAETASSNNGGEDDSGEDADEKSEEDKEDNVVGDKSTLPDEDDTRDIRPTSLVGFLEGESAYVMPLELFRDWDDYEEEVAALYKTVTAVSYEDIEQELRPPTVVPAAGSGKRAVGYSRGRAVSGIDTSDKKYGVYKPEHFYRDPLAYRILITPPMRTVFHPGNRKRDWGLPLVYLEMERQHSAKYRHTLLTLAFFAPFRLLFSQFLTILSRLNSLATTTGDWESIAADPDITIFQFGDNLHTAWDFVPAELDKDSMLAFVSRVSLASSQDGLWAKWFDITTQLLHLTVPSTSPKKEPITWVPRGLRNQAAALALVCSLSLSTPLRSKYSALI